MSAGQNRHSKLSAIHWGSKRQRGTWSIAQVGYGSWLVEIVLDSINVIFKTAYAVLLPFSRLHTYLGSLECRYGKSDWSYEGHARFVCTRRGSLKVSNVNEANEPLDSCMAGSFIDSGTSTFKKLSSTCPIPLFFLFYLDWIVTCGWKSESELDWDWSRGPETCVWQNMGSFEGSPFLRSCLERVKL